MTNVSPAPAKGAEGSDRILTRNFLCACAASLLFTMSFVMFFPTLPIFIKELGGGASFIGVLVGGASIVSLCLRPFTGSLVESMGRKRFLMLGALLLAISGISYDFASSTGALWPARILSGAGMSLYFTASMAYIGDIAPPAKRGRLVSVYGMFSTIGIATGPALGTWVITSGTFTGLNDHLRDWLPGGGSDANDRYNFTVLFVIGVLFALGAVALTSRLREVHVPVKRARASIKEMVRGSISRPAIFPAALHAATVVNVASLNTFLPLLNEQEHLWSNIGLYYTVFALSIFASRIWGGPLLDKFPRVYTIMPGLALMATGTMTLAIFQAPWTIFFTGVMMGVGSGMAQPGLQAVTIDRAKGKNLGAAAATFSMGMDVGLLTGVAVLGTILDATSFRVFYVLAALTSAVALGALAIGTVRNPSMRSKQAET